MLRAVRHRRVWTALAVLFTFALQACSTTVQSGVIQYADAGKTGSGGLFSGDIKGGSKDAGSTASDSEEFDSGNTGGEAVVKRQIVLLLPDDKLLMAPNGPESIKPVGVQVIDFSVGGPAAGVPVFWEITANEGPNAPGAGAFDNANVFTDDQGKATNVFRANKTPLTNYTVRITCDGADPVELHVAVSDTPKGNIRVKMVYDNLVALGSISVRLQASPFSCSAFKAVKPPDVSLKSLTAGLSDQPQFDDLPADKKYAVIAIAKDANNHLAAGGCADAVLVNNQETTDVTLTLTTLPLQASGIYDMVNHFDFTGAIPGTLGQVLDTAVQIFYDPGAFLIEQIKNLVKQLLPGIIVDTVFGLFEKQLSKVVTDWLLNKSPPWLQKFFGMGQEVLQIVKKLEMVGDLKIFKVTNEFFVKGEMDFTGVNLYWKSFYGCKPKDPPDCGKWALDLKNAATDPNFPLDLLTGDFTGNVAERVKLQIDSGTIKLNYGKLILFVITNVVLKSLTGESTFVGAMQKLVNCSGIAQGIGNSILGKLGLSAKTVEDICDSTVALLVLPLENLLAGLTFDSKLALNGQCLMQDDDDDLKVDQLTDGVWTGTIVTGTPGKPFKGDFTAKRKAGF